MDIFLLALLCVGVTILLIILAYMPGHIAKRRGHPNARAIEICGVIGMFCSLGIFWLVALIWAYTNPGRHIDQPIRGVRSRPLIDEDNKACPFCAETIKAAAVVCKHCCRELEDPARSKRSSAVADADFDDLIAGEIQAARQRPQR